jgi:hypothetical protein
MVKSATSASKSRHQTKGKRERRIFVRHASRHSASCHAVRSGEEGHWPATILDVSRGGMSLVVCRPFHEGEFLAVELQSPVEGLRDKLFMRVKRASTKGDGVWTLGCRFVSLLSDGELEILR